MKRAIITIGNGMVSIPQSSEVRMTAFEIATLFEVYVQTVNGGIKTILKSGIVKADIPCPLIVTGNTLMPDIYGLDMIVALSFRIESRNADVLRKWLLRKVTAKTSGLQIFDCRSMDKFSAN
jgi:hypothetical protein